VSPQPDCPGFVWIGQSFYHCDRCGADLLEHAGLEWNDEILSFPEAHERIKVFAHYCTPVFRDGEEAMPFRWEPAARKWLNEQSEKGNRP